MNFRFAMTGVSTLAVALAACDGRGGERVSSTQTGAVDLPGGIASAGVQCATTRDLSSGPLPEGCSLAPKNLVGKQIPPLSVDRSLVKLSEYRAIIPPDSTCATQVDRESVNAGGPMDQLGLARTTFECAKLFCDLNNSSLVPTYDQFRYFADGADPSLDSLCRGSLLSVDCLTAENSLGVRSVAYVPQWVVAEDGIPLIVGGTQYAFGASIPQGDRGAAFRCVKPSRQPVDK